MKPIQEVRSVVRKHLCSSLLNEHVDTVREKEIITHINKCLSEFGEELKTIAVKNNHPYVRIYLTSAIAGLKEAISVGRKTLSGIDEMILNPDMDPQKFGW